MSNYETRFNWNGIPEPRVEVTLRDQMAMAALTGIILYAKDQKITLIAKMVAEHAYAIADEMMVARTA